MPDVVRAHEGVADEEDWEVQTDEVVVTCIDVRYRSEVCATLYIPSSV